MNRKLHVVFLGLIFVFGGVQPFSGWGAPVIVDLPTNTTGHVEILDDGQYRLTNDVKSITVGKNTTSASTNRTVVLDLNGWSVSNTVGAASNNGAHLVQNYVKDFTLTNKVGKMSFIDGMGKDYTADSAFIGRGILNYKSGTMHFGGNITIRNCFAHDGGAICTQGRFYMTGGYVGEVCESIWSTKKGSNHAKRYGGGVYCDGYESKKFGWAYFEMTDGQVCYNSCESYGGGICSQHYNAKMYIGGKALVDNNYAKCGGGVEIGTSSELTLTNDAVVAFNRSYGAEGNMSGGGIAVGLERTTGGMDNTLYVKGGSVVSNLAESTSLGGGGLYMRGESSGRGRLYMSGGRVNDNVAKGNGGGIYTYGEVELTGGEIVGNVCTNDGGGVYMSQDKPFVSMGGLVSNNVARTGNGGGYYFISGVVVSNGTVVCNRAVNGGGIYATAKDSTEKLELDGGLISGNVATGNGGGIYSDIKVNMNEGVVASNRAQNGGGLYATGAGTLTLKGGEVSKNAAGDSGGGFYVNKVAATLKGSVLVDGNFAATNGGGLAVSCAAGKDIVLIGGQVRDNEAGSNGGGIWMTGRASNTGTYIGNDTAAGTDAEIYGNTAKNGGGIYLAGGTWFIVKGGYIYDNLAVGSPDASFTTAFNGGNGTGKPEGAGGGIYLERGSGSSSRSVLDFQLKAHQDIGIFGNIASNAADDVLAEGKDCTRINNLPAVTNMVLEKLAGAIVTGWNEDYRMKDSAYKEGTREIPDPNYEAERFRDAVRRGSTGVTVTTGVVENASGWMKYVCLTLGYIFPVPEKLWITDHEDVGGGKMNLQFRPYFTNEMDSAFSLPKWALAAESGQHLWLTWADDPSQLEANCSNHDHSVSVKLRDHDSAVDPDAHTVWISAPREAIVLDDPNVTNRFYKIVVDDLGEDIRKARAELSE